MSRPDVVGFLLGDAIKTLENTGISIKRINVTAPPREKSDIYDESYRVVRTSMISDKEIELLVCKPL
ncbi:MAG: hypothetical protein N3I35_08310 [Clostridia bacterium]|nr:hypothetical protein [Clostridia bacterium]